MGRRLWLRVVLAVVCLNSVWALTDVNDVVALQRLQQAWGNVMGWSGSDPCAKPWVGVICNNTRVISLNLISKELSGTIPASIGGLSALQYLDLSFNLGLGGQIPPELGSLTALNSLSLQNCSFSGSIPTSLGNLGNLTFFALNNNRFSGEIPSALGALRKLTWFDVAYNNLVGSLPVSTTSLDGLAI